MAERDLEVRRKVKAGQKVDLAELVAYQEGSVVSRTVMGARTGTVTLFAFDSGQGLSEHTAPYDALAVLLEGEADFKVDGEESRLREGEAIVLPAGRPHSLEAVGRFKMMLTMIRA